MKFDENAFLGQMQEKELILRQIQQAFDHRSWHGTNLYGSIRGVKPETAIWRPQPGRHNIWELIVHCAYWKYTVIRRIKGDKRGSFALPGSNFFARPVDPSLKALKEDIRLLKEYHQQLTELVMTMKPLDFNRTPMESTMSNRDTLIGVAAHDIYHAGQIQLLKRMVKK